MLTQEQRLAIMEASTAGRCRACNIVWYWKHSRDRRLRDTVCPRCGRHLRATTWQCTRSAWRPLEGPW